VRAPTAAWGVFATGGSAQAAVELLASDRLAARATAVGLIAVLLGANTAAHFHPRWMPIALCAAGLPLWVSHGADVLSKYDPGAAVASTLSPFLLIVGTFLMYLARQTRPRRGEP
jgi:hypothetical protein